MRFCAHCAFVFSVLFAKNVLVVGSAKLLFWASQLSRPCLMQFRRSHYLSCSLSLSLTCGGLLSAVVFLCCDSMVLGQRTNITLDILMYFTPCQVCGVSKEFDVSPLSAQLLQRGCKGTEANAGFMRGHRVQVVQVCRLEASGPVGRGRAPGGGSGQGLQTIFTSTPYGRLGRHTPPTRHLEG